MNDEAKELARRGRSLTKQAHRTAAKHEQIMAERAQVWSKAITAGASQRQLAIVAGVNPCQVAKALDRYASNGDGDA